MRGVRAWVTVAAIAATLIAATAFALAWSASPAAAYSTWQHDGAMGCVVCHGDGTPTDATCVTCHAGFESYPDETCWSCHYPGQDTAPFSTDVTPTPTPTPTEAPTATPTETPSPTPSPTSTAWNVTLGLSADEVAPGTRVTYSGTVTTAAGTPAAGTVTVQKRRADGGSWSNWRTARLRADGSYAVTVAMTSADRRWEFRARMPGTSSHTTGYSPVRTLTVLPPPTSPCSQECHLWNAAQKAYVIPFTHGANPHLGATADCLDCHETSPGIADPGKSPHHSGQATGFADCGACHSSLQNHAKKVACTKCHKSAANFHLYTASSPGYTKCGTCHKMRHARKRISQSKCASCHKGTSGRAAQHSTKVKKKYVCGTCHKQKPHARRVSKKVKSCRTCHKGKYHAVQRTPLKRACTKCHRSANHHANGFQCTLCHRRAVHATRPSAINY